MNPLIIRADANTQMGTGHVMRCIALAQAWQDKGGEVCFVSAFELPAIETRLINEGFNIIFLNVEPGSRSDAEQTAHHSHKLNGEWVVVDGYHFDGDYQKAIKDAGLKLLSIDDYGHASHYHANIVLNQNIYATEALYTNRESDTRLLLGSEYVLLRREFWRWRGWQREIPDVASKILVTLGGSDPNNVTLKIIQALNYISTITLDIVVVVGGSNPHQASLQNTANKSRHKIRLVHNVTNMPELMAWADIAISAGGSTCWELAFMGLPNLIVILADNQRFIAEKLSQMGIAVNLGWHTNLSIKEINRTLEAFVNQVGKRCCLS
ncbi:MAG: UDP-2,4-diacetamido-2,4,6-trideoxy-beta-L-altropyranose hydrolase, partial [Chloroflexi bacterium]